MAGEVFMLPDGYRIINTGGQGGGGDDHPANAAGINNGAKQIFEVYKMW
jgi:hypothetical protein